MKYNRIGFKIFLATVILAVTTTAVAGLWLSGSPAQERARRLDQTRISNLQSISGAIDQYYVTNDRLPSDLETLIRSRETYWVGAINDPESGDAYDYRIRSEDTYELCATFVTDNRNLDPRKTEPYAIYESRFWEHGPEYTCFTVTVRKPQPPVVR